MAGKPDLFGWPYKNPEWLTLENLDGSQLLAAKRQCRAAKLQHLLAQQIRLGIRAKQWTMEQYAAEVGQSPDRIARILKGQWVMRLEDVADAEIALGQTLVDWPR